MPEKKRAVQATVRKTMKATFEVTVTVELSDRLIDEVMSPDWQKDFYKFETPQDVVDHVAYNMVDPGSSIKSLDGFAHFDESDAVVIDREWEVLEG